MSKDISFNIVKGEYVICKNGSYFSLTPDQLKQVQDIANDVDRFVDPKNSDYYKKDSRNH